MNRAFLVVSVFCCGVLADHLPANLVARGKTETVLCGIDVYHSTLDALRARFAKPVTFEQYPKTEEAAEIVWDKDGSVIHATINANNVAYAVELSGKASPIARTGSGLALGQTLGEIKKIYGTRFLKRGQAVTVQWENGTELRAKIVRNKIVSLLLVANVE